MVRPNREESEKAYLAAADNVARLRVLYAETWLMKRMKSTSDQAATQATIEATDDQLTVAQSQMRVLEWRLQNERTT